VITIPRVPSYQRQVTSISIPNARVQAAGDANAYGAGVAKQVGKIGDSLTARADEMQAEDDRNSVIQAKTALDTNMTTTLYDANNGLLNQKGQNALDITNKFSQGYDKIVQETSKTLKNKRQQDVFNQYAMGQRDNYLRSVSTHQVRERQTYTEDNANAAITSAQNLAISDPANQPVFDNSMATINKTIDSVYGHRGAEVTTAMKAKALSGIRSEQATSMLSQGQGIAARDFLVAHKEEIDPKQYDNLFAGAESKAAAQESKAVSDDVFSRYGVGNERAAMKYLKDAYGNNPGYDKFSSAVQARFVDERRFKNEEDAKYKKDVANQIYSSGSLVDQLAIIEGSTLDAKTKHDLMTVVKRDAKSATEKTTPEGAFYRNYERTGLIKDTKLIEQYYERLAGSEEIDEKDQKKYNRATENYKSYTAYKLGESTTPQFTRQETAKHESDMWNAINQLANSGVSKNEIIAKINTIAPKYGFDPNYFIDNVSDWSKVGNIPGGVK